MWAATILQWQQKTDGNKIAGEENGLRGITKSGRENNILLQDSITQKADHTVDVEEKNSSHQKKSAESATSERMITLPWYVTSSRIVLAASNTNHLKTGARFRWLLPAPGNDCGE